MKDDLEVWVCYWMIGLWLFVACMFLYDAFAEPEPKTQKEQLIELQIEYYKRELGRLDMVEKEEE